MDRSRNLAAAAVFGALIVIDSWAGAQQPWPSGAQGISISVAAAPMNSAARPGATRLAQALPSPSSIGPSALSAEREQALKPKDTFKECSDCPEMVVVPAGSFLMGSPANEPGGSAGERPQHRVTFVRPFAVGKFSVTFDEWDACGEAGGCKLRLPDSGWGRGHRPAIYVTWDLAKSYAEWLSRKTGKPYWLLTEAEREYVARAGTTTPFWWGSEVAPVV